MHQATLFRHHAPCRWGQLHCHWRRDFLIGLFNHRQPEQINLTIVPEGPWEGFYLDEFVWLITLWNSISNFTIKTQRASNLEKVKEIAILHQKMTLAMPCKTGANVRRQARLLACPLLSGQIIDANRATRVPATNDRGICHRQRTIAMAAVRATGARCPTRDGVINDHGRAWRFDEHEIIPRWRNQWWTAPLGGDQLGTAWDSADVSPIVMF